MFKYLFCVIIFDRYTSLSEIAVKHLPSLKRGSIKQNHDIIYIFATLDQLIKMKNKEIDVHSKRRLTFVVYHLDTRTNIINTASVHLSESQKTIWFWKSNNGTKSKNNYQWRTKNMNSSRHKVKH